MQETPYFPLFINLEGKKIVVFGAGKIALRRVRTLQFFHTEITVITREIPADLLEVWEMLCHNGNLQIRKKAFEEEDLAENWFFVLAATGDSEVNEQIARLCKRRNVPINNASNASMCDFYFPAIAFSEEVVVGITGNGKNHRDVAEKAAMIRKCLEKADEKNNQDRQQRE